MKRVSDIQKIDETRVAPSLVSIPLMTRYEEIQPENPMIVPKSRKIEKHRKNCVFNVIFWSAGTSLVSSAPISPSYGLLILIRKNIGGRDSRPMAMNPSTSIILIKKGLNRHPIPPSP